MSVCCAGGAVDLDLAVASTLGSGLFISCVLTASVVLIRTVDVVDTTAFVRDILAYMLANLLVLCFLWNGQLAAWEASMLILLYIVYVAVACYTSRSALFILDSAEHVLMSMLCNTVNGCFIAELFCKWDNSIHSSSGANYLCVGILLLSTIHPVSCLTVQERFGSLRLVNVCPVAMTILLTLNTKHKELGCSSTAVR